MTLRDNERNAVRNYCVPTLQRSLVVIKIRKGRLGQLIDETGINQKDRRDDALVY
jgi:hypothetical protein